MKKIYMTPQTEVVRIETASIIATSLDLNKGTQVNNENYLLGREYDFDDEEEY